jgi:hypothetical protein
MKYKKGSDFFEFLKEEELEKYKYVDHFVDFNFALNEVVHEKLEKIKADNVDIEKLEKEHDVNFSKITDVCADKKLKDLFKLETILGIKIKITFES